MIIKQILAPNFSVFRVIFPETRTGFSVIRNREVGENDPFWYGIFFNNSQKQILVSVGFVYTAKTPLDETALTARC